MKKIFAAVLTLAIAVGILIPLKTSIAKAQSGQVDRNDPNLSSITLSPAVSKPSLNAGDTISNDLTVFNDGNQPYTFLVSAGPFSVKNEQYDPDYTTVNASTEAYQWVQFKKTSFYLKPGQTVKVPYTVQVPTNAAPGGHYAVLFAETQPPTGNNGSVTRKKRVGSLVYMTVSGAIKMSGQVESWSVPSWQKTLPVISELRMQNSGNTHYQTDLSVSYKDIFGRKKFTNNQQVLILPGTTRKLTIEWQKPPMFGIFKSNGQVTFLDHTEQLPQKYFIYAPRWLAYSLFGLIAIIIAGIITKKVIKSKHNGKTSKTKKA